MPISQKLIREALNEAQSYHSISLQRIGPVTASPAPNAVTLSFSTDWPAAPIIEIFNARPLTAANSVALAFPLFYGWRNDHSARLGGLEQDTLHFFRITAGTPHPDVKPSVVYGQFITGTRQARITVSDILVFRSGDAGDFLTNPRGTAEWNVLFQVFDLTLGKVLLQRRWPSAGGFESVANGSVIITPFGGAPLVIDHAPERLRLYVSATDEDTSDFPYGFNGIGTGIPLNPPMPQFPDHGDNDIADWSDAMADADLPDAIGDANQGVALDSGARELHYIMRTRIDTVVRLSNKPLPEFTDKDKVARTMDRIGNTIQIGPGKGMFMSQLQWAANRQIYYRRTDQSKIEKTGRLSQASVESWRPIEGEISGAATALLAEDDHVDLIATSPEGGALHASIGAPSEEEIKWNPLGGGVVGRITAIRALAGEIHLFGVCKRGVEHGVVAKKSGEAKWTRLRGEGFVGAVAAAQMKKTWHVFAAKGTGEVFHHHGDGDWHSLGELAQLASLSAVPADRGRKIVLLGVTHDRTVHVKVLSDREWEPGSRKWEQAGDMDELPRNTM